MQCSALHSSVKQLSVLSCSCTEQFFTELVRAQAAQVTGLLSCVTMAYLRLLWITGDYYGLLWIAINF